VFSNDFIGEEVFAYGVYERKEIETLICALDFDISQHTILDIGSNIGNHAVQFAKHFKKVICFEPNKLIFDVLLLNTRQNANVFHHNIGLSDTNEERFLHIPDDNFGGAYVTDGSGNNNVAITLKKGDEFLKDEFSVIKIDVEGHEVKALKGLEDLIKMNKPIICFELIHKTPSDLAIIELLKSMGYRHYYVPFRKSILPNSRKKSFTLSFIDGLFFKSKPLLKEIDQFSEPFYNMILCEHPESKFKIKMEMIKR
jgi:FkbM family methyltransferase